MGFERRSIWTALLAVGAVTGVLAAGGGSLAWQKGDGFRVAPLRIPTSGKTGFTLLPPGVTGVNFTNTLPDERAMTNANLMNGSGVALGDYDRDGLCDIYLCNLNGTNALYKNLGNWRFEDVTEEAGVACPNQTSTGAVFADINGDGYLDLLVTSMAGPNACFLNDGHSHFTNATAAAGLVSRLGSTSMALADVDGNGTLDLYVCNDAFTPDRCWINDGRGHFHALNRRALRSSSYFSMGADFADIDRDGYDDFLVTDMLSRQHRFVLTQKGTMHPQPRLPGDIDSRFQIRRNTLLLNRGDGTYAEIANFAGVAGSEWTWGCVFLDVDLDGWEDILISNGFAHNVDDMDARAH